MLEYLVFRLQDLSYLTNKEWVAIKATMHALDDRRFFCDECMSKYSSRRDGAEMLEKSRISKGCYAKGESYIHNIDGEIFFKKCIGNYYSTKIASLINMNELFQKGVMPMRGALFDQPAKLIEALNVIESIKRESIIKAQQAQEARSKRGR